MKKFLILGSWLALSTAVYALTDLSGAVTPKIPEAQLAVIDQSTPGAYLDVRHRHHRRHYHHRGYYPYYGYRYYEPRTYYYPYYRGGYYAYPSYRYHYPYYHGGHYEFRYRY